MIGSAAEKTLEKKFFGLIESILKRVDFSSGLLVIRAALLLDNFKSSNNL